MFPLLFLRIEKLERERTLVVQCRKNGWTDVCAELQEYENVLEEDMKAESGSFFAWQYLNIYFHMLA